MGISVPAEGNGTTARRKAVAALTTFAAMAYILAINPAILPGTGVLYIKRKGLHLRRHGYVGGVTEQLVTLCFIVQDGRVLLIRKKRGIGAGKINAPGGKVDPGEAPLAAAIRETQEEICVTPFQPQLRGELWFHFAGGPTLRCLVYLTDRFEGEPRETAEAIPQWHPTTAIPYQEMWEDDLHWLPALLAGQCFRGQVAVAGEVVTSHDIQIIGNEINVSL